MYHNYSVINEKASWISNSHAIWYTQGYWFIGSIDVIGMFSGKIYSSLGNQCPFDLLSDKWWYFDIDNTWKTAATNEINIFCLHNGENGTEQLTTPSLTNDSRGCTFPLYVGDSFCDDENNNEDCNFDGGDCCGQFVNTQYCAVCQCMSDGESSGEIGCTSCQIINITLENDAQIAQGSREGIYHNFSVINGKASWSSTTNAIWYSQGYWYIGSLDLIGLFNGRISSSLGNQCPFDQLSEKWWYLDTDKFWTNAAANEINVFCSN